MTSNPGEVSPDWQEEDRVPGRGTLWTAGIVVAVLAAAIGWAWLVSPTQDRPAGENAARPATAGTRRIGPILQTPIAPPRRHPEPAPLENRPPDAFEWVDRERGIVRIPIETAMDLVARGVSP